MKKWKKTEIKYLKNNYNKITTEKIMKFLNRSGGSILHKKGRLKLKSRIFDRELKEKFSKKNENHPLWKKRGYGYVAIHNWIRKNKSNPLICEMCEKKGYVELSNISGKYKRDINDFKWLCPKCHSIYDKKHRSFIEKYGRKKANLIKLKMSKSKRGKLNPNYSKNG